MLHPRKVGHKAVDQHVHLHPSDRWNVVVLFFNVWRQRRNRVPNVRGLVLLRQLCLQLQLQFADHRHMILQHASILSTDHLLDFAKISRQSVEHACQHLAILCLTIELVEHLIRIVDRRNGLVWPCVRHTCPSIRPIWNHYSHLDRTKACLRARISLQFVLQELID